jgi:hypothetical protein
MTEAEWLTTAHPALMLTHLGERASRRKLLLFGCAAVRRVWHLLTHKHGRRAVVAAERYADGSISQQAVVDAAGKARWQIQYALSVGEHALRAASGVADAPRHSDLGSQIADAVASVRVIAAETETTAQAELLREVFGNPFEPITFAPGWGSETVRLLAGGVYEQIAFDRMPILADALEEAGCDNPNILNHCRGPGPHIKGCWVVDLILGKE